MQVRSWNFEISNKFVDTQIWGRCNITIEYHLIHYKISYVHFGSCKKFNTLPKIYDFEEVIHYFIMDSFEKTDLINEGVS